MANLNDNRQKALDEALKKIERNFGKGSVMKLGEKVDTKISTVPSGSLALDVALGVGGYPRGRIIEVYGPESSGKTTVALHAIAEVQKKGGVAAFIDAEHALDPKYAAANRTQVNKVWKSLMHWFHQVLSTLWSSIRLPHWFRVLKLKAKWETPIWVCKHV